MAKAKSHVVKDGSKGYAATDKQGHIIPHKGPMTKEQATKQVQAIWISQHKK